MAELYSEENDCKTFLRLSAGPVKLLEAPTGSQTWQQVSLLLRSGQRELSTAQEEDVLLCLQPANEFQMLVDFIEELLYKERAQVFFEPSEPSFELSFQRTHKGAIKVEAWLDAGNGSTGFYTWDASGIRFYTNQDLLISFVSEVRREFLNEIKSKK